MGSVSEIVESQEQSTSRHFKGSSAMSIKVKEERDSKSHSYHTDSDLNKLIKEFGLRTSSRALGPSNQMTADISQENTLKKPVKARISQASGIGISESVTLKQALRRVCILQASEMAAVRRLSKPVSLPDLSEVRSTRRLYASVVVPTSETEETGTEISVVPEKFAVDLPGIFFEVSKDHKLKSSKQKGIASSHAALPTTPKVQKTRIQDVIASTETAVVPSAPGKGKAISSTSLHGFRTSSKSSNTNYSPCLKNSAFRNKTNVKKKDMGVFRCATIDEIEAEKLSIEKDAKERMEKTIESVRTNFGALRAGRASPSMLDLVEVEYYGTPVSLKSIAQISTPDASSILVQPYDKSSLKVIEKAIVSSNLGLTPNNDGEVIRLTVPQLTSERRKELTKVVAKQAEEGKVAIRNIRRDAIKEYQKLEKEKKLSEDNVKDLTSDLQKLTDEYMKKIESIQKQKEKELLSV